MSRPPPAGPGVLTLPVAVSASVLLHAGFAGLVLLSFAPKLVEPQKTPESQLAVEAYQVERSAAAEARPEAEAAAEDRAEAAPAEQGAVPQSRAEPAELRPDRAEAGTPEAETAAAAAPEADALAAAAPEAEALPTEAALAEPAAAALPEAAPVAAAPPTPEPAAATRPEAAEAEAAVPLAEAAAPVLAAAAPVVAESPAAELVAAAAPAADSAAPVAVEAEPLTAAAPAPEMAASPVVTPAPVAASPAPAAPAPAAEIAAPTLAPADPEAPVLAAAEAPAEAAEARPAPAEAAAATPPPAEPAAATPPSLEDAAAATPAGEAAPDRSRDAAEPLPETPPPAEKGKATLAPVGPDGELDPKSLDAIQAFMQPGDAAAAASAVHDGIEGLLAAVPCSRLQVEFDPETGTLALRGHIPDEALQGPVLAALEEQIGAGIPVVADLRILPRPQCGALSGIADIGLPQSSDQTSNPRIVGEDSFAREFAYRGGDKMTFDLNAPDYDAYVYVDFFDAGGDVIHLIPNDRIPLTLTPAKAPLDVGKKRDDQPYLDITIGPPYGKEIAVAFAASTPLYPGLRPFSEPADAYLAELKRLVAEARAADPAFKGEWVYFFISTSE